MRGVAGGQAGVCRPPGGGMQTWRAGEQAATPKLALPRCPARTARIAV